MEKQDETKERWNGSGTAASTFNPGSRKAEASGFLGVWGQHGPRPAKVTVRASLSPSVSMSTHFPHPLWYLLGSQPYVKEDECLLPSHRLLETYCRGPWNTTIVHFMGEVHGHSSCSYSGWGARVVWSESVVGMTNEVFPSWRCACHSIRAFL